MPAWTAHPLGMKNIEQKMVTSLFTQQLGDWKTDHGLCFSSYVLSSEMLPELYEACLTPHLGLHPFANMSDSLSWGFIRVPT